MTLQGVRDTAALVLIIGHITAILLVFLLLSRYFEKMDEKLEIVLILSPLTGLFALAALKHILKTPTAARRKATVGLSYAMVCIGIPAIFVAFVIYTIARYPFSVADSPSALRITLSALEVALGGLLGAVAEQLFRVDLSELSVAEQKRIKAQS